LHLFDFTGGNVATLRLALAPGAATRAPSTRKRRSQYRLAAVQNTAQEVLEAGNSPQMIFGHYRELVRGLDAEKWFGITPASVETAKAVRESGAESKIVPLPKTAAA